MTARPGFRWLQGGLLFLGLLLLAWWSRDYFEARGFQSAETRKLEADLRVAESGVAEAAPRDAAFADPLGSDPSKHAAASVGVLGRIEIPRLRISAIIAEGSDAGTLRRAVGHITSTALPGGRGNVALAGHRDTFFRGLGGVRVDDVIRIVTREATYTYKVAWTAVVRPQRVDVLDSTATPSLTLITCFPFHWIGHAPNRFVVRAVRAEASAGRPDQAPGPQPARSRSPGAVGTSGLHVHPVGGPGRSHPLASFVRWPLGEGA